MTVVTCVPNHPTGSVFEGYRNRLFQRELRDGIEVLRVWTFLTANKGFLKRTVNYLSFMVACIWIAPFLPRADVVVTTSPQFFNGLAGYPVSRIKRIPWILEIRDLWPDTIVVLGAIQNRTVIRILKWLEDFAYRKADCIVPVTDSFQRYLLDKGIPQKKIHVIKNGVDLSFFEPGRIDPAMAATLGVKGKFVVAYFGTHGMAHHLETLLDAAELLKHDPDIVFLMVGDGAEKANLSRLKTARGLDNVIMLGQQPKDRMPHLWGIANVSLVLLKNAPLFKTVIPSKIFESMAMEKPILLAVRGECADLIADAGAGICIEPEDPRALADAVLQSKEDPEGSREKGIRGRVYVESHFQRHELARRYLEQIEELVGQESEPVPCG